MIIKIITLIKRLIKYKYHIISIFNFFIKMEEL